MLDEVLNRLDLGLPRSWGPVDLAYVMDAAHTPGVSIALIEDGAITETRCGDWAPRVTSASCSPIPPA
jgi:hypothetical protein